jgi:hypothetical protein
MTKGLYQEWQFLLLKALLEPIESPDLFRLVKEAEMAISQRLQELPAAFNGNGEREAIQEALPSLRHLKHENFRRSAVLRTEIQQFRRQ